MMELFFLKEKFGLEEKFGVIFEFFTNTCSLVLFA